MDRLRRAALYIQARTLATRPKTVPPEWAHGLAANRLWLRDNCPCEICRPSGSTQKGHRSSDVTAAQTAVLSSGWKLPLSDRGTSKLHIVWADGHASEYTREFLERWHGGSQGSNPHGLPAVQPWRQVADVPRIVLRNDAGNLKAAAKSLCAAIATHGLALVSVADVRPIWSVADVAEQLLLTPIRRTFYGRTWEVCAAAPSPDVGGDCATQTRSTPDPDSGSCAERSNNKVNIASTQLPLSLHMDLLYMQDPPGIQLLHFVNPASVAQKDLNGDASPAAGGESIFVDMDDCWPLFAAENPLHARTLCRVPTVFAFQSPSQSRLYAHPMASRGTDGLTRYAYAPQFQGPQLPPFPGSDKSAIGAWYIAMRRWEQFLDVYQSPAHEIMMPARHMAVFNNRRILHGRRAFCDTQRLLHGCYVDWDDYASAYRRTYCFEN